MSWFDHGEAHVYYEESGTGDTLLLLPGWGGTIDEFAPLRAALEPNFRVIAGDLPGSGKSGPQPRTYTPTLYQDDARCFSPCWMPWERRQRTSSDSVTAANTHC